MKCQTCGKEIKSYKSTEGKKKFCSIECRERKTHIKVKCRQCGKDYKIAKSRYNGKYIKYKMCSEECYSKFKQNKKEKHHHICTACGVSFVSPRKNKTTMCFCSQKCSINYMKGENSYAYKNGFVINSAGYKCIKIGDKYIYEHRLIMEEHLKRKLKSYEVVHHIDGNKLNNNIKNLKLMKKSEHDKLHTERRNAKNSSRGI